MYCCCIYTMIQWTRASWREFSLFDPRKRRNKVANGPKQGPFGTSQEKPNGRKFIFEIPVVKLRIHFWTLTPKFGIRKKSFLKWVETSISAKRQTDVTRTAVCSESRAQQKSAKLRCLEVTSRKTETFTTTKDNGLTLRVAWSQGLFLGERAG